MNICKFQMKYFRSPKMMWFKKISILLVVIHAFCINNYLQAEKTEILENEKKYQLSICAVFKNEGKYLKEWIEYHQLIGVDHFYLYDFGSSDSSLNILKPYLQSNMVTLIQWPKICNEAIEKNTELQFLSRNIPALENAIKVKAGPETKWLVFLDINEFLTFPKNETIIQILNRYDGYPGISLNSEFYDASNWLSDDNKLLTQVVDLTQAVEKNKIVSVAKTIFKPDFYNNFTWPPYQIQFKDHLSSIPISTYELKINHYIKNKTDSGIFNAGKEKIASDKSEMSSVEHSSIFQPNTIIEDKEKTIQRFLPELLTKMGYDNKIDDNF